MNDLGDHPIPVRDGEYPGLLVRLTYTHALKAVILEHGGTLMKRVMEHDASFTRKAKSSISPGYGPKNQRGLKFQTVTTFGTRFGGHTFHFL